MRTDWAYERIGRYNEINMSIYLKNILFDNIYPVLFLSVTKEKQCDEIRLTLLTLSIMLIIIVKTKIASFISKSRLFVLEYLTEIIKNKFFK